MEFSEAGFIIAVVDPTAGSISSGIGLVRMFVINLESKIIKRAPLFIVNEFQNDLKEMLKRWRGEWRFGG